MPEDFRFKRGDGAGGFMAPPGHGLHVWSLETYTSKRSNARCTGSYTLESAVESDWVPAPIRERAARLLAESELIPSELWIRHVYGYFKNAWSPDGVESRASQLSFERPDGAPLEWHAATMVVRKYFPDHEPRADLIENPGKGYGSFPCVKCDQRVQYEARLDALAVVSTSMSGAGITQWRRDPVCPSGGAHEVGE